MLPEAMHSDQNHLQARQRMLAICMVDLGSCLCWGSNKKRKMVCENEGGKKKKERAEQKIRLEGKK